MKSRFAVAVLTALLVFPFTAKAQMPGSDIAWMRTCSSEREALQAYIHRTFGADKVMTPASRISSIEEALHGIFEQKKVFEGLIAEPGQDAASLRSLLAEGQAAITTMLADYAQSQPNAASYGRCVITDLGNFVQAKIQARLDEIGKATQGFADYTPAPIPTYTPPAKGTVDPFPEDSNGRPVTPSGAPCLIPSPTKGRVVHGGRDFERYDVDMKNQCKAPITVTISYNGHSESIGVPAESTRLWFCTVGFLGNTDCPGGKYDAVARWQGQR
ncbi:MAG: hypothetical protein ABL956_10875 [Hyphomonadaceae bacterium]